jgi:hypothetical protein
MKKYRYWIKWDRNNSDINKKYYVWQFTSKSGRGKSATKKCLATGGDDAGN